jgi:hypothetical protein
MREAVDSVAANFRNRGMQAREVADQVEQEIVFTLEEVIKQHKHVSRQMHDDASCLARSMKDVFRSHRSIGKRYHAVCLEAEHAAQEVIDSISLPQAQRFKLAVKSLGLSRQAREVEVEYYRSVERANKARALYDEHMPPILEKVQDMEEKRLECIKDVLMKLSVFEHSWLRNLQYDLESMVKATQNLSSSQDVQGFLRTNGHVHVAPAPVTALHFFDHATSKLPKIQPVAKTPLQLEGEAVFKKQLRRLQPTLEWIVSQAPDDSYEDEAQQAVGQFLSQGKLDQLSIRAAFCRVLRDEIARLYPPGQPLESAPPLKIGAAAFEMLAELVKEALDHCDRQVLDVFNARDIMVLSYLLQTTNKETSKPVTMLSRIYTHPIWSKVTFWEDALCVGLCEAHSCESLLRRNMPPGQMFTQVTMTTFLQRFLHYMVSFGIKLEQATDCVQRTVSKNLALLGPEGGMYIDRIIQNGPTSTAPPANMAPHSKEDSRNSDNISTAPASEQGAVTREGSDQDDAFEALALGTATDSNFEAVAFGARPADDGFEADALGVGSEEDALGRSDIKADLEPK